MAAKGKARDTIAARDSTAQKLGTNHDNGGAVASMRVWTNQRVDLARNERVLMRIEGSRRCSIATRGAMVEAALKVRGHQVVRRDDGSYDATHQHHTKLLDFSARRVSDLKRLLGVSS